MAQDAARTPKATQPTPVGDRRGVARPLTAAIRVAAPPAAVWAVVSDVRRTGEWSPECRRVWVPGRLGTGCWLFGFNRRGAVRWMTVSRVTSYRPNEEISWRVITNGSVWTYRLETVAGGTRLVETRETPSGVTSFAAWFTRRFLGGQAAHDDELEAGMAAGLARINAIVDNARDEAA